MKHFLGLSADYVSDWTDWHAIRELLQNAMDARDTGKHHEPIVEWRADHDGSDTGTLTIASPGERLDRSTLLLGKTTKANDSRQRGQFGEGYKLAMLVLARGLHDVRLTNGGEVWTPSIEAHPDFDGEQVLFVTVRAADEDNAYDGVRFTIGGFKRRSWELVCLRYRPAAENDSVLLDVRDQGNVFSGGLFVTRSVKLLMGYNFRPGRLNLGRDRDLVGEFDLQWHASDVWKQSCNGSQEHRRTVTHLMKSGAPDVEYLSEIPDAVGGFVLKEYEKEFGEGTTPVTTQRELEELNAAGMRGQIVPGVLCKALRAVKEWCQPVKHTPGGKVKAFRDKHHAKMDLDAQEDLNVLVSESVCWR